jgi:hypothetical protein
VTREHTENLLITRNTNHVPGQLINLAGNESFDLESYLQTNVCSGLLCNLSVYADPTFKEWAETPDP